MICTLISYPPSSCIHIPSFSLCPILMLSSFLQSSPWH
jgi:hypothetical protein